MTKVMTLSHNKSSYFYAFGHKNNNNQTFYKILEHLEYNYNLPSLGPTINHVEMIKMG